MNKFDFDSMNREELAHFMVANRDSLEGIEAGQVYIRRMAKKAESLGIDFYQVGNQQETILSHISTEQK